jgi:hypothetical protein
MDQEPDWAADDPEIAALLCFAPVERRIVREDGWSPAHQRGFIAWLAGCGDVTEAAKAVGRGANGARLLRKDDVVGEFAAAWGRALALYRNRNGDPSRPPLTAPRHARALPDGRVRQESESDLDEAEKAELIAEIVKRYGTKLRAERQARLEGRITEADFYVRQLSFIELVLDIGGRTQELLDAFREAGVPLPEAAATPGSTLLEKARRAFWQEKGEADRPPPAPLGRHNDRYATGRDDYDPARDGDRKDWERRREEKRKLAAEAQAEWERRAKGEPFRPSPGPANDSPEEPSGPLAARREHPGEDGQ